jgi:chemotaxis protein MotA
VNIAAVIGLLGALGFIISAMIAAAGMGAYIDVPSMQIVFGGTLFCVMYRSKMPDFIGFWGSLLKIFLPGNPKKEDMIARMSELAALARKDGMMALEGQESTDKFFGKGMQLLVDGADESKLTAMMKIEIEAMVIRHRKIIDVHSAWIDIAPAMGMIGTLVGLVAMLGGMDDPKSIGPAMAVALLTTLYGAFLANVIFMPMVSVLKDNDQYETEYRNMVLLGLQSIARGDSPRNMLDVMVSYMPPKQQEALLEAA